MENAMERKLAAILAADVVGYSAHMETDEAGTFSRVRAGREELFEPEIKKHHGRIFKLMGDGLLAEFGSVVDAVECAVTLQRGMVERNASIPEAKRIKVRIGINLGEVIVEGDDRYGEGVNVAVRLQELADPGGICVSGKVSKEVEKTLAFGFEPMGEQRVKNIVEPIACFRVNLRVVPSTQPASSMPIAPGSLNKTTIAVLPFSNMSGDSEQEYFSDGITEDIITELSRFHSLFVIARNSSFQYRDKAVDVRRVARELGVQYVVEGSVRKMGSRVRITAQLIDAMSGNHLWSERYDRKLDELFDVQDEVTRTIVATVVGRMEEAEVKGAVHRRTENLAAYDSLLRGMDLLRPSYVTDDNQLARELFESAIRLDPKYALAHAYLAWALLVEHGYGDAPVAIKDRALETALTGVRLDPGEGRCHRILAIAYHHRGEFDLALSHFERAVELNPNDANGIARMGLALATSGGRAEEGIELIRQAMRLNPFHPESYWDDLAIASYAARRYDEALEANRRIVGRKQYWYFARMAACYAQLGRLDEARAQVGEALRLKPDFRLSAVKLFYKNPTDAEHVIEGMRKAGFPE
jgi:adenylate cyclase